MATLKQKTAKSNVTVKRIGKNATITKKLKINKEFYGEDRFFGWSEKDERSFISDSGIGETYSYTTRSDNSWD
tara:strand:- start:2602 stop:2820 length:219 start_codon:yes stop_codon:yes gene_type:complete